MPKAVHHVVTRPGLHLGEPDVEIPVAEDLITVPGNPIREEDVVFYSREYPPETQNIEKAADREWAWTIYTPEVLEYRKKHDEVNEPIVAAAVNTADIEPTGEPDPGRDFSEDVRKRPGNSALARSASPDTTAATPSPAKSGGQNSRM